MFEGANLIPEELCGAAACQGPLPANKQPTQALRERKYVLLMHVLCEEKITHPHMGSSSHAAFDNQRNSDLWWLTVPNGRAWGCFKLSLFSFCFACKWMVKWSLSQLVRCPDKIVRLWQNMHKSALLPTSFQLFFSSSPHSYPYVLQMY